MTQLDTEILLAPGLRAAIAGVDVGDDGLSARVGHQHVSADYPREMARVLAEAIYNVFHAGQDISTVPSRLRDRGVEARLLAATPHRSTRAPVDLVRVAEASDGVPRALVSYRGVRVWVPAEGLPLEGAAPGSALSVPFPAARPAVSPGYFLTESSREWARGAGVVRLYLHVPTVDAAVAAWGVVLRHLEHVGAAYRAKVLTAAEFYPRRDSFVVYLDDTAHALAEELAERVAAQGLLAQETSVFAHRLRAGAATAAEPADPDSGFAGLSFGQHRATLLASALLAARGNPVSVEKEVSTTFAQHGADPAAPARNLAVRPGRS